MKTIAFDIEKAKQVEGLVCLEFGCSVGDLVCYKDTFFKKAVVFLLVHHLGFDKRIVGRKYQISHLYVPTVLAEINYMEKVVTVFKVKISLIKNQLQYEEVLDGTGK